MEEKLRFKFFPTRRLHTSVNSFSPMENTLKTETNHNLYNITGNNGKIEKNLDFKVERMQSYITFQLTDFYYYENKNKSVIPNYHNHKVNYTWQAS